MLDQTQIRCQMAAKAGGGLGMVGIWRVSKEGEKRQSPGWKPVASGPLEKQLRG
jgi:hypothetical protein